MELKLTDAYAKECREAMEAEKTRSLAQTNNWGHVDRDKVHASWKSLYIQMAQALDQNVPPLNETFQEMVGKHFNIIKEFYVPSKQAYIGMSLFYVEDEEFRKYHDSFHPQLASSLSEAMQHYAMANL